MNARKEKIKNSVLDITDSTDLPGSLDTQNIRRKDKKDEINDKNKKYQEEKNFENNNIKRVKFNKKIDIINIECWKKYNSELTTEENFDNLYTKDDDENNDKKRKNKNSKNKKEHVSCSCIIV